MNNIKVSVIIPVWNPGEGINKCIDNLRNQTLKDIEMIFIDDLGTDDSMDKVRAAASEDSRIRIITNPKNMGAGPSRNAGIEASRGEYLAFLDPDDYVAEDCYELLYKKAKEKDLDIVKGRVCYKLEDGTVYPHYDLNEHIRSQLKDGKPLYMLFTYEHDSAIFRRELLMRTGARYGLARRAQDTTFLLMVCNAVKTFDIEDDAIKNYCERQKSTMHINKPSALKNLLFSFQEQVDYICDSLADDPWARHYTSTLFITNLRFLMLFEGVAENEPHIREHIKGLREQLLRLPFIDKMKKRCFPARVLIEKGVVLPYSPGHLPWNTPTSDDWLAMIELWISFLSDNPSYAWSAVSSLYPLCTKTRRVGKAEGKEAAVNNKMKKLIKRLPILAKLRLRLSLMRGNAAYYAPGWLLKLHKKLTKH